MQDSLQSYFRRLDGFASLSRHHYAKKDIREAQLKSLPLKPHTRILDIGIGPGLYLPFWLKHTTEVCAHFTCFDLSEEALAACRYVAESLGETERVTTMQGDFNSLPRNETYDVVFVGNTLEYIPEPELWIKHQILPLLNRGGIVAIRDLDCGILGCNLVDPALTAKIVQARIAGCQLISKISRFHDPFIGRDLARILSAAGLEVIKHQLYSCEFVAPLSDDQIQYLSQLHTSWYVEDHANHLTDDEKSTWRRLFDSNSADCILTKAGFFYTESEFLAYGKVSQ